MKNYGKILTDKDVTTKQYVDNKNGLSQDDADARYLQLSGGVLHGNLYLDTDKKIVFRDSRDGFFNETTLNLIGSMPIGPDEGDIIATLPNAILKIDSSVYLTKDISLNNKKIHYIADPTAPQDATNKKYVDDIIAPVSTKATSAETKATAAQNALANKQDKITGTANKLVGINASGVAAVTDTFTINGPITIGNVRIQYNSSTKSLDFLPIS